MNNLSQRLFTKEEVLSIRDPRNNLTLEEMANQYGVAINTVWRVRHGLTYKEIEFPRDPEEGSAG